MCQAEDSASCRESLVHRSQSNGYLNLQSSPHLFFFFTTSHLRYSLPHPPHHNHCTSSKPPRGCPTPATESRQFFLEHPVSSRQLESSLRARPPQLLSVLHAARQCSDPADASSALCSTPTSPLSPLTRTTMPSTGTRPSRAAWRGGRGRPGHKGDHKQGEEGPEMVCPPPARQRAKKVDGEWMSSFLRHSNPS